GRVGLSEGAGGAQFNQSNPRAPHLVTLSPCHLVTALGALIAVGVLAASGTGRWLREGRARPLEEQFTTDTPFRLTATLKEGLADDPELRQRLGEAVPLRILPASQWSDYLVYHLPPGARVYEYTHWHCYRLQQFSDGNYIMKTLTVPHDWHKMI